MVSSFSISVTDSGSPHRGKRVRHLEQETGKAEENPYMDERIWSRLPEDLMAKVVSFLPISMILRSALICKSWNSIISSPLFLKLNSEIPPNSRHPWFLIFLRKSSDYCLAYDPSLNRWIDLPFPFVTSPFRPIAAGDGLVCLISNTPSGLSASVCNPVSKFQYKIPTPTSLLRYFFLVSGLFLDKNSGFFRLVLVGSERMSNGSDQFVLRAEIYYSEMELWFLAISFPVTCPVSPYRAISNGVLYCLLGNFPMSIVALDVESRVWFMLKAQLPPSLTVVRLMDHNDKLVMIGGVGVKGITEEIGIWQLDDSGREWKMIRWIGNEICNLFLRSLTRKFSCIGHGDLIYFTCKRCPFVVMYVISRSCVKFLDLSPRLLDPHYDVTGEFCFEPRL
ncbi:hypothetical protein AAC387_Pa03g4528 [Persea americana]